MKKLFCAFLSLVLPLCLCLFTSACTMPVNQISQTCTHKDKEHDGICDLCQTRVSIIHTYANDCDADCETCGFLRETSHTYSSDCSPVCDVCSYVRENVVHTDINLDGICDICTEEIETVAPEKPEAIPTPDTIFTFELTNDRSSYKITKVNSDTITSANIPATFKGLPVTEMNGNIFAYCAKLESITADENSEAFKVTDGFICTKDGKRLIACPRAKKNNFITNIPDGVEIIEKYAFAWANFSDVAVVCSPESLTVIEEYAFQGILGGQTGYSYNFSNSNLQIIGDYAFSLSFIRTITLPASVKSIGELVFDRCMSLSAINVETENAVAYKSIDGVLYTKDGKTLIWFPANKTDFLFTIPEGVEKIEKYAFYKAEGIFGALTLPDSLKSIGEYAFHSCQNLKEIILSEESRLESIGDFAFYNCQALMDIYIPKTVTYIGDTAFGGCRILTVTVSLLEAPKTWHADWDKGCMLICWEE